jgi:hypothetical protein
MLKVNVNSAAQMRLKVHNDLLLNSGRDVYNNSSGLTPISYQ